MKTSNEYANGRLSIIKELRIFCEKKTQEIKDSNETSELKNITKGGVIKGYATILEILDNKERNIIKKLSSRSTTE